MTRSSPVKLTLALALVFKSGGLAAAEAPPPDAPGAVAPNIEEWRLDLTDGEQEKVTFELRPVGTPTSFATIEGLVPGKTVVLRRVFLGGDSVLTFGNPVVPVERWLVLKERVRRELERMMPKETVAEEPTPPAPPAAPANGEGIQVGAGPLPGLTTVSLPTEALGTLRDVTSVLVALAPNKATVLGAVVAEGLVMLDQLGGEKGFSVITALPFANMTMIVPKDPVQCAKNVASLINPVKQLKRSGQLLDKGTDVLLRPLPPPVRKYVTPSIQYPGRTIEHLIRRPHKILPWHW
jgi:hypothetical protein